MRTFKPTYRDNKGKIRKVKKWWIETRDHLGIVRRFAGHTDQDATELLGRQIERLAGYRMAGEQPDRELSAWLNNIPSKMRQRFVKVGLLDPERASSGKSLAEHLADFRVSLQDKDNSPAYVELTISRTSKVFKGCKFIYWTDINANRVQRYLADLRDNGNGISAQTFNHYLTNLKVFSNWMVQNRRASENPLQYLSGLNVRTDRRHDRRAISVDEIRRLLETTAGQPERFGMTGCGRSLLYRLAVETGLRRNELRTLTVGCFDFDRLTVKVEAGYSKHRREDVLPLRPDTAAQLRGFLIGKLPNVQAFDVPERTSEMLRADLEAAGIAYVDESGLYADFHSLRHDTGTLLAAANVAPKVSQMLMRHSDINLTMSRYTHTQTGQGAQAVESLPDLSAPSSRAQQALKNLA
jgi:integrase